MKKNHISAILSYFLSVAAVSAQEPASQPPPSDGKEPPRCEQIRDKDEFARCIKERLAPDRNPVDDGTRSGDGRPELGSWRADIEQSGVYCAPPPYADFELWREDEAQAMPLEIKNADGRAVILSWPAGKRLLDWPESLPLSEGAQYTLNFQGKQTVLRFRATPTETPPDVPPDMKNAWRMAWMAEAGCLAQASYMYHSGEWK